MRLVGYCVWSLVWASITVSTAGNYSAAYPVGAALFNGMMGFAAGYIGKAIVSR